MRLVRSADHARAVSRRRLMVVERGASLTCRDDVEVFDETIALTQLPGEAPAELAERALSRLAQAERSRTFFDSLLLAVSEEGAGEARRLLGLGLASHGTSSGAARELVIIAPARPSAELRDELLQLTDELLLGAERPLQVRLRFAAERGQALQSGTFWSIPAPDEDDAEPA
jgi:hypothetical protein